MGASSSLDYFELFKLLFIMLYIFADFPMLSLQMKKEKAVLQRVYSYQGTCEERYALLAEVEHWMSSTDLVG